MSHQELRHKIIAQRNFTDDPGDATNDVRGHGTRTISIYAGNTNNSFGIAGISPGVRVVCSKVQTINPANPDNLLLNNEDVIAGLRFGESHGAQIHTMSFGDLPWSFELASLIQELHWKNVIIASAGNSGRKVDGDAPRWPCSYQGVLCVSGTNETGTEFASGASNYGPAIDLSAPATNIYHAGSDYDTDIDEGRGTSFAAPTVAGAAAIYLSVHPTSDASEVRHALTQTATDIEAPGYDVYSGYGVVNVGRVAARASRQ